MNQHKMTRIIELSKSSPYKLTPQNRTVWLCQCGLSRTKPFCDGSHTRTLGEDIDKLYQYTNLTQRRLLIDNSLREQIISDRNKEDKVVEVIRDLKVVRVCKSTDLMEQVMAIRKSRSPQPEIDLIDRYSDVYLLFKEDKPCATMRVTQARHGLLDIENYYPSEILNSSLRKVIGSANKLYKYSESGCGHRDILDFIQMVWSDQYIDGMRIDLINATIPMVRYYSNLGYMKVGGRFIHPWTQKESQAMLYIANRANNSKLTNMLFTCFVEDQNLEEYNWITGELALNQRGNGLLE